MDEQLQLAKSMICYHLTMLLRPVSGQNGKNVPHAQLEWPLEYACFARVYRTAYTLRRAEVTYARDAGSI